MLDDSLEFLKALGDATRRGIVTWRIVPDDERDLYEATVDGEVVTVEQLMLRNLDGAGERAFVRVAGLKTWEVFARGTAGYQLVMSMLSENIFGWKEGNAGAIKSLRNATARIRALLGSD